MKTFIFRVCFFTIVLLLPVVASAQSSDEGVSATLSDNDSQVEVVDASSPEVVDAQPEIVANEAQVAEADGGFHMVLKKKFIEGNAFFMSLVALALVLGLAFCIEREANDNRTKRPPQFAAGAGFIGCVLRFRRNQPVVK